MPNNEQKRQDRQTEQKQISDYIGKKQAQQKAKAENEEVNLNQAAAGSN
jgi:hypothetical protein